jgi:predicted CXXCH cytochrome family protein
MYYDWPVGFHVGLSLADFWRLEEHKLGETSFTHFADGSAHKNRMQGNDFVQSLMYARGVTCFSCHDPHGTENQAMLREAGNAMCLTCHGPNTACRQHRAAHASRGRQHGQCLRGLSYAGNCRDSRRRESPQPYISFRLAGADRNAEDSKRVRSLSHGQDDRLGDGGAPRLERSLALAFTVR